MASSLVEHLKVKCLLKKPTQDDIIEAKVTTVFLKIHREISVAFLKSVGIHSGHMYIKGTGTLATKAHCVFKEYANKKSCKEPSVGLAFPGDSLLLFGNKRFNLFFDGRRDGQKLKIATSQCSKY